MAALGSRDGREIVRELDALYAAQRLGRLDDGRYVLKTNGKELARSAGLKAPAQYRRTSESRRMPRLSRG